MIYSMTAYAQAKVDTEIGELSCELRSVNHRYLEIAPRMPEELRVYEGDLRELVGKELARGRVDCFIRIKENESNSLEPNPQMVANLKALISQMRDQLPDMQDMRAIDVLRWPGVLQAKKADPKHMQQCLQQVLKEALEGLLVSRGQEGQKMVELIEQRLDGMREVIAEVETFLPEISTNYRTRLEDKFVEFKDQLDPARLEQEMLIFLQKTDVAEELDRLNVHMQEIAAVLVKPEPAGRRLDFLMQELNREANTLGSKAHDSRLTKASVDLKVLIEQMREQIQNIE